MLCCLTKASDFLSSDLPLFFCFFFFNILFVCLHFFIIIFFSLPPLCCIFDQMCFVGVQFPWNVPQWLWLAVCSLISWSTALFIVIFFRIFAIGFWFGFWLDATESSSRTETALKLLWSCSDRRVFISFDMFIFSLLVTKRTQSVGNLQVLFAFLLNAFYVEPVAKLLWNCCEIARLSVI